MRLMPIRHLLSSVLAGGMVCVPAYAQSIGASCSTSNSSMAFASYNPISAEPLLSNATITINCTATVGLSVSYTLLLSAGNSGNVRTRAMSSGSASLSYNLYSDSSYSGVWDNSSGVSGKVDVVGSPGSFHGASTQTVYGRIPALQTVPAGLYTDGLTITISY